MEIEKKPRYSVSRKRYQDRPCKTCGRPISHPKVYCDNRCQHDLTRLMAVESVRAGLDIGSVALKHYLTEQFGYKCAWCGLGGIWNGKPITLQLDHPDGNCMNNTKDNGRWLCPNCHTQTPNYGAKNMGNSRRSKTRP